MEKNEMNMTEEDLIRTMPFDDLAEFLCSITDCYGGKCPAADLCSHRCNGMKIYLKQKAKEE